MIQLVTPLNYDKIKDLRAGDQVTLTGVIYTARDAAHKRFMELLDDHQQLPFDMRNQIIYFAGPAPAAPGEVIGSCGPTSSYRMDAYSPRLLDLGLLGMIGKGERNKEVKDAIVRNGGIYFGAIGGAGAVISASIKKCDVIAFDDLGTEAIRRLEVENMPLTVLIDTKGNDLYEIGRQTYLERRK